MGSELWHCAYEMRIMCRLRILCLLNPLMRQDEMIKTDCDIKQQLISVHKGHICALACLMSPISHLLCKWIIRAYSTET